MIVFDNNVVQIYRADARNLPIPDNSIDCVVTSPPYWGLRDYGVPDAIGQELTPEMYLSNIVTVFREVWRVLKPTGTAWLNLGDSYVEKGLVGIPWRVAFALQADGWYLRSDIIWSKPNPMPESVTDRPTKAHEYVFLLTKSPRYYYDADAIREPASNAGAVISLGEKSFAKRQALGANISPSGNGLSDIYTVPGHRNKRTVWEIPTQPYPEAHFAVYPEKLVEPCILAGCPQEGVVLDPFVGSGTTLAVAQKLGRRAIGTDLNPVYLELAAKRLSKMTLPMQLL